MNPLPFFVQLLLALVLKPHGRAVLYIIKWTWSHVTVMWIIDSFLWVLPIHFSMLK